MLRSIYEKLKFFVIMMTVYYVLSTASVIWSFIKWEGGLVQTTWSKLTCALLQAKFRKLEGSANLMEKQKGIILLNHRSWSDFFVHDSILNWNANFLARNLVGLVIPVAFITQQWMTTLWFFNRSSVGKDFNKFYSWIDKKWSKSCRENLMVYPEGHRMFDATKPGPIKKGMIKYAFERQLPVQIAICLGNENLVNERKIQIQIGAESTYYLDQPIEANKFSDFQSYFAHIEKRFAECFSKVYEAHYPKKS